MKKRLTLIIITSFLLFQGADKWEGSAAVAPDGELPSTGLFITTNRFPKNTLVEITNIENGKKASVYVSNTLTSPGLLAVVSREAAELLGMRTGSISRIKMEQITAPITYINQPEKMNAQVPDSEDLIDEEKLTEEVYSKDTYAPPVAGKPAETPTKPPTLPPYIVDPDWLEGNGSLFTELQGYGEPSEQPSLTQTPPDPESDTKKEELVQEPQEFPLTAERREEDVVKEPSTEIAEKIPQEPIKDNPSFIPEVPKKDFEKEVSPRPEKAEVATVLPVQQPKQEEPQQPDTEIQNQPKPEIQNPTVAEVQNPTDRQILKPNETGPRPPSPPYFFDMFPEDFISGIGSNTPKKTNERVNENPPPKANENPTFKTIPRLDRGKYYVQVAALPVDLVESALKQIDRGFAPVVFKGADNMYRILIGPLNQGESAAVLVRFKSIGYKDAFVRVGG